MKSIKILLAAILFAASPDASAQISIEDATNSENPHGWNTIYISWNPSSFVPENGDSKSFTGFSIGYNRTFPTSQSIPLYLETGFGLQYSYYKDSGTRHSTDFEKDVHYKDAYKFLSGKIPVNIGYEYKIPDSKYAIMPYAGIALRGTYIKVNETETAKGGSSICDSDVCLIQLEWNIGINLKYKDKLLVGVSYGKSLHNIYTNWNGIGGNDSNWYSTNNDVSTHTTSVTLGYCF